MSKGVFMFSQRKQAEESNKKWQQEKERESIFGLDVAAEKTPKQQIVDNLNSLAAVGSYYNQLDAGKVFWRITPAIRENRIWDEILCRMGEEKIKVFLDKRDPWVKRYLVDDFRQRLEYLIEQDVETWGDVKNPLETETYIWGVWELAVVVGYRESARLLLNEAATAGDITAQKIVAELQEKGVYI